jgi:putative DNA primase/helicase
MTIHNQLLTDTAEIDLKALIQEYGPPHYPTKRNKVGILNEPFWAGFLATLNEFIYENREDQFYRYGGRIYLPTSEHLLREQLRNDIKRAASTWPGYQPLAELCNARHLSGVLTHLKGMVQLEGVFNRKRDYIHVENGVILLNGTPPKLVPFTPRLISRNLIPIAYDPEAKCLKFKEQLLKPLPAEDVLLVQKLFGMFIGGINFLQKILILQGAPGSGKSALATVARLLIGIDNCEELRTAHLGDRFELARYMAKTLLIASDVAGDFLNQPGAHNLKKMTGGDLIGIERKYSNQASSMAGTFPVLITCNSHLTVKLDGDRGAWGRRLLLVNYEQKKHTKDIPGFAHKLVNEEGPGILNWALEGLVLANKDVEDTGTIATTEAQRKRVDGLLDESEGLRIFVKVHIVADPQKDLTTQEIIEKYATYCSDPDRQWAISNKLLERQLASIMLAEFHISVSTHLVRNGKRARGYLNVDYVP